MARRTRELTALLHQGYQDYIHERRLEGSDTEIDLALKRAVLPLFVSTVTDRSFEWIWEEDGKNYTQVAEEDKKIILLLLGFDPEVFYISQTSERNPQGGEIRCMEYGRFYYVCRKHR